MNKINIIMTFAFLSINSSLSPSRAKASRKMDEQIPTTLEVLKFQLGKNVQFDDEFLSTIATESDDLTRTKALGKVKTSNRLFIDSELKEIKGIIERPEITGLVETEHSLSSKLKNVLRLVELINQFDSDETNDTLIFATAASINVLKKEYEALKTETRIVQGSIKP